MFVYECGRVYVCDLCFCEMCVSLSGAGCGVLSPCVPTRWDQNPWEWHGSRKPASEVNIWDSPWRQAPWRQEGGWLGGLGGGRRKGRLIDKAKKAFMTSPVSVATGPKHDSSSALICSEGLGDARQGVTHRHGHWWLSVTDRWQNVCLTHILTHTR